MPVSAICLRSELERVLGRPIAAIERQPGTYGSSHPIEEVEIRFLAGEPLRLVAKDAPSGEVTAYEQVLRPRKLDVPTYHGTLAKPECGGRWLLLDAVDGVPLWQVGELEAWEQAARWLAGLHASGTPARELELMAYGAEYFEPWMGRAVGRSDAPALAALAVHWQRVVERLLDWPPTTVHGDFYPSNVLVEHRSPRPRVLPIDWERAGRGPGLLDLAALSSGRWTVAERERLALAYHGALAPADRPSPAELVDALRYFRLFVAVQWLGWSRDWSPPAEHAHDWLGDVIGLVEELELS